MNGKRKCRMDVNEWDLDVRTNGSFNRGRLNVVEWPSIVNERMNETSGAVCV